jgi:hypothetical protein
MTQQATGAERVTTSIDKSAWGQGPWIDEPDRVNFMTENGMDACINRVKHSGCLCGYVGVDAAHPWFGKEYSAQVKATAEQLAAPIDTDRISILAVFLMAMGSEAPADEANIDCLVRVHGGVTYADKGREEFGEDPGLWYFGFDCSHSGDLSPSYDFSFRDGEYRDVNYVRSEIESMSAQLANVK